MATNTYVALKKETIAVAAGTVDMDLAGTSGYTDLVLVMNFTPASGSMNPTVRVGAGTIDTAGNYSQTFVSGTGSVANSNRTTNSTNFQSYINAATTNLSTVIVEIRSYSSASIFKPVIIKANGSGETTVSAGTWRSTSAIDKIQIIGGANFAVGSTFSLYGIAAEAVSPAPKATGGVIYSDNNYYYHVFGATGAFVPSQTISGEYLVVAGGGGGGSNNTAAGGGGAGGYRSSMVGQLSGALSSPESAVSLVSGTSYTVTVGGGGGGGNSSAGTAGTASSIIGGAVSISAVGGGGGSTGSAPVGGSGGGGAGQTGALTGVAGTSLQGFAGGNGLQTSSNYSAGGGGGAGSVGSNGVEAFGGNGGAGITANLYGSVTLAGGGGGGASNDAGGPASSAAGLGAAGGGNGGRGSSTFGQNGFAALSNTGSGGGGGGTHTAVAVYQGGAGGSGIVMIRYLKA